MRSTNVTCILVGAIVIAGTMAPAQAKTGQNASAGSFPPNAPTLYVTTQEVVLDVVVTDLKGNVVTQLKKDDFKIYEDGVLQTIRSFTAPSERDKEIADTPIVSSSADLGKIGTKPVTILVLDELDTRFEDMAYARAALERYLLRQPATLLQPTVLLVVDDKKFDVLHDYTQDRAALLETLKQHFPAYPFRMARGSLTDAGERMAMALGALTQIAQASSGVRGRKNVIWVGCGFPSISTDMDDTNSKTADELVQAVKDSTQVLLDARVTLNVIDPTLMASSVVDTSDPDFLTPQDIINATDESGNDLFPGNINFAQFAPATGGFAYSMRNDVDREIASAIQKGSNYFTLTYSPTNHSGDPTAFRKIRIMMSRPGLFANTRTGYYAEHQREPDKKPTAPTTRQLAFDLTNAALSRVVYNGLDVKVDPAKDGYTLRVPAKEFSFLAEPNNVKGVEVTVMTVCFGFRARVLDHTPRELTAHLPDDISQDIAFKVPMVVPPGTIRIRFVVRDAMAGKIGTAEVLLH